MSAISSSRPTPTPTSEGQVLLPPHSSSSTKMQPITAVGRKATKAAAPGRSRRISTMPATTHTSESRQRPATHSCMERSCSGLEFAIPASRKTSITSVQNAVQSIAAMGNRYFMPASWWILLRSYRVRPNAASRPKATSSAEVRHPYAGKVALVMPWRFPSGL